MRILLTGGTGFIGSHFLKQALAKNHSVVALRRSPQSKPKISIDREPEWLNRHLDEVTKADIAGCDVVVHLAAHSVQHPFDNLTTCLYWNTTAALHLFEQARLAGVKHYVVAGSCFEYGLSADRFETIPTDAPLEPNNSYAVSKAVTSIALRQWTCEHQLSIELLRIFHVFGEGESKTRFWPSLRRAALSGKNFSMTPGQQMRDFLPVEDVAQIFVRRAILDQLYNQRYNVFNIGTGSPCTLLAFAKYWWSFWKAEGKLLVGDIPYRENEIMSYLPGEELLLTDKATIYT